MSEREIIKTAASCRHAEIANRLLVRIMEKEQRCSSRKVEAKTFELSHFEGSPYTYVWIEVGMVNDEGTAASILCRDRRHFSIGKRGGVTLINAKKKSERTGRINLIYSQTH